MFKISVYDAIQWLHSSLNEIKKSTVQSCFAKAGFILPDSLVNTEDEPDDDEEQISAAEPSDDFLHFDDNVAVCGDEDTDDSDVEPDEDDPEVESSIKTFAKSVQLLQEVQLFAVSQGFTALSDKMVEFRRMFEKGIVKNKSRTSVQSILHKYWVS